MGEIVVIEELDSGGYSNAVGNRAKSGAYATFEDDLDGVVDNIREIFDGDHQKEGE